jgi:drug/metabolite transporter (DMT)-like permease
MGLLIGLLATVAQLLVTRAHAYAPAARIGPFMYSIVVFSALLGWLLWDERMDQWSVLGGALVTGAAILAGRVSKRAV